MKNILLLVAMFASSFAHAEGLVGTYKCVSHIDFKFHELAIQENAEGYYDFILDNVTLDNVESGIAENGVDILVWPMDEKDVDIDELYCKPQ